MYCPPPSVSCYACIMHAYRKTKQSQASNAAKATTTRPTDQKEPRRKPQNQKERQKGLGANPGHETIPEFTLPLRQDLLQSLLGPFRGSQWWFAMLRLHFCKCIPYFDIALLQVHLTLPGIVAANDLQHSCVALWPAWSSQTPIP